MQNWFTLIKIALRTGWPLLVSFGAYFIYFQNATWRILPGILSAILVGACVWLSPVVALMISYKRYRRGKGSVIAVILAICCVLSINCAWAGILLANVSSDEFLGTLMCIIQYPLESGMFLIFHSAFMVALFNILMAIFITIRLLINIKKTGSSAKPSRFLISNSPTPRKN